MPPETTENYRKTMPYRLIADDSALREAASELRRPSRIALDCEAAGFHRYSDKLCLVQLSTPDHTFLFDPLAADPAPVLRPILEDPDIEVVMHGSDFDLRLLHRDLDIRVLGLFDTQVAATLLGAGSIGLASLLEEYMEIRLSKAHQRADWAKRPLSEELLDYAASDTQHLLELGTLLRKQLGETGRLEWAREEFNFLQTIQWTEDRTDPVTRFKGARHLTPRQIALLRVALSWRDRIAEARDRAPFRVVGDPVLAAIVIERPTSLGALKDLKGMSPRLADSHGQELLAELERVESLPDGELTPYPRGDNSGPGRLTPEEDLIADKIRSLRTKTASDLGLDKGVLLSNAQILKIVRSMPASQEALEALPGIRRWQAERLGVDILRILAGGHVT